MKTGLKWLLDELERLGHHDLINQYYVQNRIYQKDLHKRDIVRRIELFEGQLKELQKGTPHYAHVEKRIDALQRRKEKYCD